MDQLLETVREQFDIVIFDMPPVVAVTDAQIMAAKVDGTFLVARENVARKDQVLQAEKLFKMVDSKILGIVYNGAEISKDKDYYY